ncbi:MAG: polysaccharide biosynthesis protein [Planctomycetota bacterium]
MNAWRRKRAFDVALALLGLVVTAPLLALLALLIKLAAPGPVLFRQQRVGRGGKPFVLFKLRTMVVGTGGPSLTVAGDERVTRCGRWLRRTRLDELPQLYNVLRGDMSFVGPRPELAQLIDFDSDQERRLLAVRPGLASRAALLHLDEERHLPRDDPERYYRTHIRPRKVELDLAWLEQWSFARDLEVLFGTALKAIERPLRSIAKRAIDLSLAAVALTVATLLRFDGPPHGIDLRAFVLMLCVRPVLRVLSLQVAELYRHMWRYFTLRDAAAIACANAPLTLALFALRFALADALHLLRPPLSVTALEYLLVVSMQCLARLLFSMSHSTQESQPCTRSAWRGRVLFVGAGHTGVLVLRDLMRRADWRAQPIGFLDEDPLKRHALVAGCPVLGGLADARRILHDARPDLVVITTHLAGRRLRALVEQARAAGSEVRIVPSPGELVLGQRAISAVRPVGVEDLIGRRSVELEPTDPEVARTYRGRRVLVTGAAGSIGSELCRLLTRLEPAELLLVDKDESGVFQLTRELAAIAPHLPQVALVRDLRDRRALSILFERLRPEVVLHAAAHKHVPLMERNEAEAIRNNLFVSRSLYRQAARVGCRVFVFISSDKAVHPTSVMGATKRASELCLRAAAARCATQLKIVRFGNVLGSRGSVSEIFKEQIAQGGPLTITDPRMRRYFMTLREASELVLVAGSLEQRAAAYVLDMGEPIRVIDLARDMIRLSGLNEGLDIDLSISGLRAGEKLCEELAFSSAPQRSAAHPKILLDREAEVDRRELAQALRAMRFAALLDSGDVARRALAAPAIGLAARGLTSRSAATRPGISSSRHRSSP